jgi:hypothetical protein
VARIDPGTEDVGKHLGAEADTEDVLVHVDRFLDETGLVPEIGGAVHLVDRHGTAHDDKVRIGLKVRKGLTLFEVDEGKRNVRSPEMVLNGAGAFGGNILDDEHVHRFPLGQGLFLISLEKHVMILRTALDTDQIGYAPDKGGCILDGQ